MLYADDLILLAESEEDLQNQMNSLGKYADSLKMEINQKKQMYLYLINQQILRNVFLKFGQ